MTNGTKHTESRWAAWVTGGGILGGGMLGSVGAFIGASCCVLPILLFNMGVGSAFIAQLGFFARYRDEFLYGSLALIIIGMIVTFAGGGRPTRRVLLLFAVGLLFIGIAYALPSFERELLGMIRAARNSP